MNGPDAAAAPATSAEAEAPADLGNGGDGSDAAEDAAVEREVMPGALGAGTLAGHATPHFVENALTAPRVRLRIGIATWLPPAAGGADGTVLVCCAGPLSAIR
jgi:hypothetical protein